MIRPSPSVNYLQHPNVYIERKVHIGKRLVIVAESDDGEFFNPTLVYNTTMAIDLFGGGDLVQAYEDACTYEEGLQVYLMRMQPYSYELVFSVLEAFHFDLIFLNEVHFDVNREVIHQFLEFAKVKEELGNLIHGITTLKHADSYLELTSLIEPIKGLSIDEGDDIRELGKYLSVVVNQGELRDAGAVYAGMLASIEPEVSPINKTIPGFNLRFEFSKDEIHSLRSIGIVCFKNTFKKGVTCTSSSCAVSTEGSVHKHISNFRIAQFLINQVATELQPFIGKPHVLLQAQSMEDIIDGICMEHIRIGRIRDYAYHLTVQELRGIVEIEIEIVPIFSVHSMTTHTRVRVYK